MIALKAAPPSRLPELDSLEVATGMVFGPRRSPAADLDRLPVGGPRETLEEILEPALQRSPCVVAFSGGRDSSAILAEATRVARLHGLPDPVPFTLRFPGAPRTEEQEWQELVIRHLGLRDWQKRDVDGELDTLGPIGARVLRRHGVHWPPNAHTFALFLEPAAGGALVTGNGGDELFHPWAGHRIALIRRGRAVPRRFDVRPFLWMYLPTAALTQWVRRRTWFDLPWLTPEAAREAERAYAKHSMRLARTRWEDLEAYLHSRYREVGPTFTRGVARDMGVELVEPFFDPRFVRSVYADGPAEGFPTRTAAVEHCFGDLLPAKVSSRSTKAVFTEVFWGPESRRFAESWNGHGVDPAMIDCERMREAWLAPVPDIRTLVPLQAAWMASSHV